MRKKLGVSIADIIVLLLFLLLCGLSVIPYKDYIYVLPGPLYCAGMLVVPILLCIASGYVCAMTAGIFLPVSAAPGGSRKRLWIFAIVSCVLLVYVGFVSAWGFGGFSLPLWFTEPKEPMQRGIEILGAILYVTRPGRGRPTL